MQYFSYKNFRTIFNTILNNIFLSSIKNPIGFYIIFVLKYNFLNHEIFNFGK
jgi:hypothetical protein